MIKADPMPEGRPIRDPRIPQRDELVIRILSGRIS